jgi:hypothetical protein
MKFHKKYEDKITSIIRLFFLTLIMSWLVILFKLGYSPDYFINWMKAWFVVMLIVYPSMCFVISPFVIKKIAKKIWPKKWQMVWMLFLTLIMWIFFTYRFDVPTETIIRDILKNRWILIVVVMPLVRFIITPAITPLVKKIIK